MIDWVSFSLPYSGPPVGLQYFKRERWDSPIEPAFSKPLRVEGSYSSTLTVQAIGARLYISGNPVKFFTGQNVAGTNDLPRLVRMTVQAVWDLLDLVPCLDAYRALESGDVNLTRVDCTFSYQVGSDDDVVTWLEAMERACHVRFRGRGHYDQGMCSLMFGLTLQEGQKAKASRRSTFKFYNKHREMGVHPPTCDDATAALLRKTVYGAVRGEACYRALELQRYGKDRLSAWTHDTALELHRDWVDRMEMAETFTLKSDQEKQLPRNLQATYHLWRSGVDVRGLLSERSFYRHRKELLALAGVDIAQPRLTAHDPVKVIPIIRVLEAKPMPEEELEALFWRLAKAA
jgi:hypothetical protein